MLGFRRIDRYVLRELATPTLLGLALYTFALLMNHFFLVAEKSLSKGLSFDLTLRIFLVGIPQIIVLSLPMAVLLGSLIAVGRLSADHEWVALQSAGRGPGVLLRPVVLHGLLGTLAAMFVYGVLVPQTHYAFRNLRGKILFSSNLAADLKPRVFYELPDESVLLVDEISPGRDRRLEGVLLIQRAEDKVTTNFVLAKIGDLYPSTDGSGALIVDLYDGEARAYRTDEPETYRYSRFRRAEGRRIEPPPFVQALLAPPEKVVQDLSLGELWHEQREAAREAARVRAEADPEHEQGTIYVANRRAALAAVELHQRFALPAASLVFALLALPLGVANVRSGRGAGFALSLIVILVYRVVFVLTRNQALEGRIPAALGPWIADLLILVCAVIAYQRLRRPPRGQARLWSFFARIAARLRRRGPARRATPLPDGDEAGSGVVGELATLGGTRRRLVRRLDRYVGLAYVRVLVFALASAYLIYGLVELQSLMDDLLRTRQPMSLVLRYFQYFAPTVFHVVLPIACLISGVVAITVLSRNGELVAVKASGVGMRRTTAPVLFLTLGMCVLLFFVQDRIAPAAQRRAQAIKDQIEGHVPRSHGAPINGRWTFGPEGRRLYHYRQYVPSRQEFQGLSVFTLDRATPRVLDQRFATRAVWRNGRWTLSDSWYRSFAPERYERHEGDIEVVLDDPRHLVGQGDESVSAVNPVDLSAQMSLSEMGEQIRTLRNSGYDITNLRVAYYGKFSHAAAPLVMVLLGLPFAFRVGRRGSLYGIGVALILVLVYWATFAIFNALGLETLLLPLVAAWAPNVLFGLLGFYLLLYVRT